LHQNQEGERPCIICVLRRSDFAYASTIIIEFWIVPTMRYLMKVHLLSFLLPVDVSILLI
jgi:disulfide bond formation protein DsbB